MAASAMRADSTLCPTLLGIRLGTSCVAGFNETEITITDAGCQRIRLGLLCAWHFNFQLTGVSTAGHCEDQWARPMLLRNLPFGTSDSVKLFNCTTFD